VHQFSSQAFRVYEFRTDEVLRIGQKCKRLPALRLHVTTGLLFVSVSLEEPAILVKFCVKSCQYVYDQLALLEILFFLWKVASQVVVRRQ
jgi:hypothetical protein